MLRSGAMALSVALAACSSSEPPHACTLIGCDDGLIQFFVVELADPSPLFAAEVRVCRNSLCSQGLAPTRLDSRTTLEGAIAATVRLEASGQGGALGVTIGRTGEYPYGLADGDIYRAEIDADDGTSLASGIWDARYTESCPNGPDCEPCPCITGQLSRR